jgi:hypothetical protein
MSRNIHQSRKNKNRKPAATFKTTAKPVPAEQTAAAPLQAKVSEARIAAAQKAEAERYAELPYDVKRIALFSAVVVVLLIVLWLFLK